MPALFSPRRFPSILFVAALALPLAGCDSADEGPRRATAGLGVRGFAVTTPERPEVEPGRVCGRPTRTSGPITAVPNPYPGASAYEAGEDDRRLRFINLPEQVRVEVVRAYWAESDGPHDPRGAVGDTVRVIEKDSPSRSLDWDLRDAAGDLVPSGFYRVFFTLTEGDAAALGLGGAAVFDDVYVVQRTVPLSDLDPASGITVETLNPTWADPTGCL